MIAKTKRRPGWWEHGVTYGFSKQHGYDWPIDRDTHERKIAGLAARREAGIPLKFLTAIESSKRLLDLGADWDDAGALPIEEDTWKRATDLLRRTLVKTGAAAANTLPVPNISPCADGSIDIFWKNRRFTLLVNIQPTDATPDFYAETADGLTFEGSFTNKTRDLSVILRSLLG